MPTQRPRSSSTTKILILDLSMHGFVCPQWQMEGEHRPAVRSVGHFHQPPVSCDNLLNDPKPQTAPFCLGREKWLEHGGLLVRWNSRSCVMHREGQHTVLLLHATAHFHTPIPLN